MRNGLKHINVDVFIYGIGVLTLQMPMIKMTQEKRRMKNMIPRERWMIFISSLPTPEGCSTLP